MRLPNAERSLVERSKITDYLLCVSHPDGAGKADFFCRFGFKVEKWQVLAQALQRHGQNHEVTNAVESQFGIRYCVDGEIETPDGRNPSVRSVWIVEEGKYRPRLITAHPVQEAE